jgi:hypothetical protein
LVQIAPCYVSEIILFQNVCHVNPVFLQNSMNDRTIRYREAQIRPEVSTVRLQIKPKDHIVVLQRMHISDIVRQAPDHFQPELHIAIVAGNVDLLRDIPFDIKHGAVIAQAHDQLILRNDKPQVYTRFLFTLGKTETEYIDCQLFKA